MSEPEGRIDAQIARIGRRIRTWREEAGLTLQELATRSDLATSTVQKVETGQMIPSVAVLLKVASGLGRRATDFIHEGDAPIDVVHARAADRTTIGRKGVMQLERLSTDLSDPTLEMWRVALSPGGHSGAEPIAYRGEEIVCCEAGRVTFALDGHDYVLESGDVLHFKAGIPHRWRNDGDDDAVFTVTGTLPHQLRELIRQRATTGRRRAG